MFKNIDMSNLEIVKGIELFLKGLDRDFIGNEYDINDFCLSEEWESWDDWDICNIEMELNKDFDYICRVKELCNLVSLDLEDLGKINKVVEEMNNWLRDLIDEELDIVE